MRDPWVLSTHPLSHFVLQWSSGFSVFIPSHRWGIEVQRGKGTCSKISASKYGMQIWISTVFSAPWCEHARSGWSPHGNGYLELLEAHLEQCLQPPQNDLSVGGKGYPSCAKKLTYYFIFLCYLSGALDDGKGGLKPPILKHFEIFVSLATRREKKNQKKYRIVSRNVSSYDSKIYRGADLLTQKGPFLSHLAAFATL